jgi:hypothetical protein
VRAAFKKFGSSAPFSWSMDRVSRRYLERLERLSRREDRWYGVTYPGEIVRGNRSSWIQERRMVLTVTSGVDEEYGIALRSSRWSWSRRERQNVVFSNEAPEALHATASSFVQAVNAYYDARGIDATGVFVLHEPNVHRVAFPLQGSYSRILPSGKETVTPYPSLEALAEDVRLREQERTARLTSSGVKSVT